MRARPGAVACRPTPSTFSNGGYEAAAPIRRWIFADSVISAGGCLGPSAEGNGSAERREIWLDRVVRRLGFGWLACRLPGSPSPALTYAVVAVGLTNAILLAYTLAAGGDPVYETNPYYALEVVLLPAAVVAARSLHREYDRAMDEMRIAERTTDPDPLLNIVPRWLPWSLLGLGITLQFLVPGPVETYGVVATIDNFVVLPFVYTPIVIQFFTTYFAIEILAPIRLWRSDVGIDFLDPEGVGGLRPIGELIKKSYYYVAVGLVGYALITYAPFIDWGWRVAPEANYLFTAIWAVTIAGVAFGVFVLHRFMHREKREEIRFLRNELRDHIENPYDVKTYDVPDEKAEIVDDLRERIRRVDATGEYPATFSIWSQLLLSIALPKAIQFVLAGA